MKGQGRTRATWSRPSTGASADAWKGTAHRQGVGLTSVTVRSSRDADKIVTDCRGHVLNVIRNPWSAYADTKNGPLPLPLYHYITGWCLHQQAALTFSASTPAASPNLRFEDIVGGPRRRAGQVPGQVRGWRRARRWPARAWNGQVLEQVYPPGGPVRIPNEPKPSWRTPAAELSSARAAGRSTTGRSPCWAWSVTRTSWARRGARGEHGSTGPRSTPVLE